jgi:uncharacterized cupin superfamily protein
MVFVVLAIDGWMTARYWQVRVQPALDAFPVSNVQRTDWKPAWMPIEWITEGNPATRAVPLMAADAGFYAGLWDSRAGRFTFHYFVDEVVHILEGEVHIRDEVGREATLRAGDVALFPKGRVLHWHIPKYVKKLAVMRESRDPLTVRVIRKVKRLFGAA